MVPQLPHPHPLHQNNLLVTPQKLFHSFPPAAAAAAAAWPLPWWELTSPRQRLKPVGAAGEAWELWQENLPQNSHRTFFAKVSHRSFLPQKKLHRVHTMTTIVFSLVTGSNLLPYLVV